MVRCIVAVLFLVGEGRETPDVIDRLFDIDAMPAKPQYEMAADHPLVLHECGFDNLLVNSQPSVLWSLAAHFEADWERHSIAAARARNTINFLNQRLVRSVDASDWCRQCAQKAGVDASAIDAVSEGSVYWGDVMSRLASMGLRVHDASKGKYIPILEVSFLRSVVCVQLCTSFVRSESAGTAMRLVKPILPARREVATSDTRTSRARPPRRTLGSSPACESRAPSLTT